MPPSTINMFNATMRARKKMRTEMQFATAGAVAKHRTRDSAAAACGAAAAAAAS